MRSASPPVRSPAASHGALRSFVSTSREETSRRLRLESVTPSSRYDEERLAELLRGLPPAPDAWVKAAQELPSARRSLDEIVERARADAEFRRALIADLETALAGAGYEPSPLLLESVRERLSS